MGTRTKAHKPKLRIRWGREIYLQHQTVLWRKREKRFKELYPKVMAALAAAFPTAEDAVRWLDTPNPKLKGGGTPRSRLNRTSIGQLWPVVKALRKPETDTPATEQRDGASDTLPHSPL